MKLSSFTLKDLILISFLASLSIVTKPFIYWLSATLTASLHMPAGIVGGIYYMMWLSLVYRIVGKPFTVLFFCVMQAFLAITVNNMFILKAFTFIPPGIVAEIIFHLLKNYKNQTVVNMLVGALANVVGSCASYLLFINKQSSSAFLVLITVSFLSGSISGILTSFIHSKIINILPFNYLKKANI